MSDTEDQRRGECRAGRERRSKTSARHGHQLERAYPTATAGPVRASRRIFSSTAHVALDVRRGCSMEPVLFLYTEVPMPSRVVKLLIAALLISAPASAQSAIAGLVRDASGAVLPGVTVEASSPSLIEGTRTAVTDGAGQYRIQDLRPGEYIITFTLTGFRTVKRDGITL